MCDGRIDCRWTLNDEKNCLNPSTTQKTEAAAKMEPGEKPSSHSFFFFFANWIFCNFSVLHLHAKHCKEIVWLRLHPSILTCVLCKVRNLEKKSVFIIFSHWINFCIPVCLKCTFLRGRERASVCKQFSEKLLQSIKISEQLF